MLKECSAGKRGRPSDSLYGNTRLCGWYLYLSPGVRKALVAIHVRYPRVSPTCVTHVHHPRVSTARIAHVYHPYSQPTHMKRLRDSCVWSNHQDEILAKLKASAGGSFVSEVVTKI